ncbi:MAG: glutamate 5-kinase [Phycisphaerales bacterium]|nr:glutamate 5-kinase [Phycisphaerales bacterium]
MGIPDVQSLRPGLVQARRVVVKVGSAVLASEGRVDARAVARIAASLATAHAGTRGKEQGAGREVVLVTSGAVASGWSGLGLDAPPATIVDKQASAAIGQPRLMALYAASLDAAGVRSAQVLLTSDDLRERARFLNARRTLLRLLEAGVVPIINENDSVVFDEIRVGDNDRLSALVADAIGADLLVILTSVEGVHDGDRVIDRIDEPRGAMGHVRAEKTLAGTGGMATKLEAAALGSESGAHVVIASGRIEGTLSRVLAGEEVGTWIPARRTGAARKRWIAAATRAGGVLVIDEGAARALRERGASLLPKGVVDVRGSFDAGESVDIAGPGGERIARGLAIYSDRDCRAIMGKRSDEIAGVLGYAYDECVVHRDDMVVEMRGGANGGAA